MLFIATNICHHGKLEGLNYPLEIQGMSVSVTALGKGLNSRNKSQNKISIQCQGQWERTKQSQNPVSYRIRYPVLKTYKTAGDFRASSRSGCHQRNWKSNLPGTECMCPSPRSHLQKGCHCFRPLMSVGFNVCLCTEVDGIGKCIRYTYCTLTCSSSLNELWPVFFSSCYSIVLCTLRSVRVVIIHRGIVKW